MINKSVRIQTFLACFCYFILSFAVFTPVFLAKNLPITLITAFLTGLISVLISLSVFDKDFNAIRFSKAFFNLFAIIASLSAAIYSLLIMTEVIRDTTYISAREVSLKEYILLSIAILVLSFYLCTNGEKGIFRLCIISAVPCLILFLMLLLPLIFNMSFPDFPLEFTNQHTADSTFLGIKYGLFISGDFNIFLYCFKPYILTKSVSGQKKTVTISYVISFFVVSICILSSYFILGNRLTSAVKDPFYSMSKLIPGYDFTEIISVQRILSFTVKSSVYLFASAKLLHISLFKNSFSRVKIIIYVYALIPILAFFLYLLYGKSGGYGVLQNFYLPSALCCFGLFLLCLLFLRKKE